MQEYINCKKEIQNEFLSLFGIDQDNGDVSLDSFIRLVNDQKILEDENEFKSLLHLINEISLNHHRSPNFFNIIDNILLSFEKEFKKYLKNQEIFFIFKSNNRILLTLIEHQILKIDQHIANYIYYHETRQKAKYFIKEIRPFLNKEYINDIEENCKVDENIFEQNRKIGENETDICEIIRKDQIEDFVIFINKNNIPIDMKIPKSIFETNFYLQKKEPTLIEYAAFFGSIQIFNYLQSKAELHPALWLYAVHGKNPEIINFLEEKHIEPEENSYSKVYEESILCHHNEFAEYIKNNYQNYNENIHAIFECYNYENIQRNFLLFV